MSSKWSPSHINQPSPTWVKVVRWVVITVQPIIIANIPSMPVHADTKYWIVFFSSIVGSAAILFGEGFKQKTLNEKAINK